MQWKNGGGWTAEIDRFPQSDRYAWRLSQATVSSDGPFSVFSGYDRWLMVWKGEGLYLNNRRIPPLAPYRFSGDQSIDCRRVGKEILDIGLIFDRTQVNAEMKVVNGSVDLADGDKPRRLRG